jgi:hypothetical protein
VGCAAQPADDHGLVYDLFNSFSPVATAAGLAANPAAN